MMVKEFPSTACVGIDAGGIDAGGSGCCVGIVVGELHVQSLICWYSAAFARTTM